MDNMRNLTLSKINDITTRINSAQDLGGLLKTIMDTARELIDSEASSLLLHEPETGDLIFDVVIGSGGDQLESKRIESGKGIAGICAKTRKPIIVNDAANDERIFRGIDKEINFVTRNLMATPMLARDELIGVLEVVNTVDGREYDSRDLRTMRYLANMAALSIRNRQLYEDAHERAEELQCIYDISQSIGHADDMEEVLESVLLSIEEVLGATRTSAILLHEKTGKADLARMRGFSLADDDKYIDPYHGVSGIVLRTGDPLLVRDLEKDLHLETPSDRGYKTRSFVSVPVKLGDRNIGILNAADKITGQSFDSFELKVLSTIAGQIGDAYGRFLSRKRELELMGYRKDLETAAMIQMNSLPQIPARIAGLEIGVRYEASHEVGGDFYDLIYHSDDRISMVMADVAGKGVPAALFMEYSKTLLAGEISRNLDPATSMTRANKEIFGRSQMAIFVTVFLAQIEREMFRIRFCSAGHNRQILYRRQTDEIELLITKGPPLGVMEGSEFLEEVCEYAPGDILILYTDGITEAENPQYEEYGEERFFDQIRRNKGEPPSIMIDVIFADINRFREGMKPSDDATMTVTVL